MGDLDAPRDDTDAVTAADTTGDVIRCRRVEVIDGDGDVRIVAGDLSPTAGFGVAVLDGSGARRIVIAIDRDGPIIVLDQGGTIAVELGVHDDAGDADGPPPGAYAMLNDATGRPVAGLRVSRDGTVTFIGDLGSPRDPPRQGG